MRIRPWHLLPLLVVTMGSGGFGNPGCGGGGTKWRGDVEGEWAVVWSESELFYSEGGVTEYDYAFPSEGGAATSFEGITPVTIACGPGLVHCPIDVLDLREDTLRIRQPADARIAVDFFRHGASGGRTRIREKATMYETTDSTTRAPIAAAEFYAVWEDRAFGDEGCYTTVNADVAFQGIDAGTPTQLSGTITVRYDGCFVDDAGQRIGLITIDTPFTATRL